MSHQDDLILDAITRANKAGAQGVEVVGFAQGALASHTGTYFLITKIPDIRTASDPQWYEETNKR